MIQTKSSAHKPITEERRPNCASAPKRRAKRYRFCAAKRVAARSRTAYGPYQAGINLTEDNALVRTAAAKNLSEDHDRHCSRDAAAERPCELEEQLGGQGYRIWKKVVLLKPSPPGRGLGKGPLTDATLASHHPHPDPLPEGEGAECIICDCPNTGVTFAQYINSLRIERACHYLEKADLTITEICDAVGLNSVSNFNRQFLAAKGVPTSKFRVPGRDGRRFASAA